MGRVADDVFLKLFALNPANDYQTSVEINHADDPACSQATNEMRPASGLRDAVSRL